MEVHHNPVVPGVPRGNRFILLDRDGVINEERPDYVKSVEELSILAPALLGLRLLHQVGYRVVVVTNQSAIGRGVIDRNRLREIHRALFEVTEAAGGRIERIYYCPHAPKDDCLCRKPKPGLLLKAKEDLGINLERTFFVGDKISDILAAVVVGCRSAFVGRGETWGGEADVAGPDLLQVVFRILTMERLLIAKNSPQSAERINRNERKNFGE